MQRLAAEDQHRSTIICVQPWVMMVRDIVRVIALSMTCGTVRACASCGSSRGSGRHHHRLVHRVAEHREHRRQHRQRELPLEEREEAQDDDDVVQVRDDRRDRELPFEAHRTGRPRCRSRRTAAPARRSPELPADLRPDELDALQLHASGRRLRSASITRSDSLRAGHALLHRQADQHVARACRSSAPRHR